MLSLRGPLLALCLASAAGAQADGQPAARDALDAARCQTSLPGEPRATERAGDRASEPARERGAPRQEPRSSEEESAVRMSSSGGGDLASVLLWVGVGVAAVVLVAAIVRHVDGERAARAAKLAVVARASSAPAAAAPAVELPDYERFAAAGDFAAAVHALLAHAIGAWMRGGGAAPAHATARDVLRRVRAMRRAPAAVEPFAQLVGVVERVHFGGAAADRGSFEASREHLRQWESACPPRR